MNNCASTTAEERALRSEILSSRLEQYRLLRLLEARRGIPFLPAGDTSLQLVPPHPPSSHLVLAGQQQLVPLPSTKTETETSDDKVKVENVNVNHLTGTKKKQKQKREESGYLPRLAAAAHALACHGQRADAVAVGQAAAMSTTDTRSGTLERITPNKPARPVPAETAESTAATANTTKTYVDNISPLDVLFGRGSRSNLHAGNQRYQREKDALQPRYRKASKYDKAAIAQELVDKVKAWGGRFLKQDEDSPWSQWYEAPAMEVRKKASRTLRQMNTPEYRLIKRIKYSNYYQPVKDKRKKAGDSPKPPPPPPPPQQPQQPQQPQKEVKKDEYTTSTAAGTDTRVKRWTPEQVAEWILNIEGLSREDANMLIQQKLNGSELLAFERDDLKDAGITRLGTVALVTQGIRMLRKREEEAEAEEEEDSCSKGKRPHHR